jgi:hypothetical protein
MGDSLPLPDLDGVFRFYPSLGHGAIYEMSLNPFASRAGKRPQGLAHLAWLDCR